MSIRVLVVEDDLPTLALMQEVLASFEVDVVPMADSEEAFAAVNREKFDGIFLDLMMPRLNGFRLAEAIRKSGWNKTTPIVVVTSNSERSTMQEAFRAGGNFFLQKPIDRKRLTILLNSTRGAMLENRRSVQRAAIDVEVLCVTRSLSASVRSHNLSARGILLDSTDGFPLGETVRLSFRLPRQSTQLHATGVVVRRDERGRMGINFSHISNTDRQRIMLYVGDEVQRQVGT